MIFNAETYDTADLISMRVEYWHPYKLESMPQTHCTHSHLIGLNSNLPYMQKYKVWDQQPINRMETIKVKKNSSMFFHTFLPIYIYYIQRMKYREL